MTELARSRKVRHASAPADERQRGEHVTQRTRTTPRSVRSTPVPRRLEPAQRRGGRGRVRRRRRHHRLRRQPPPRPAVHRRRPAPDLRQPPDARLRRAWSARCGRWPTAWPCCWPHAGMIPPGGNDFDPDLHTVHTLVAVDEGGGAGGSRSSRRRRPPGTSTRGARGADRGAARPAGPAVSVPDRRRPGSLRGPAAAGPAARAARRPLGARRRPRAREVPRRPPARARCSSTSRPNSPTRRRRPTGRHPLPSVQRLQAAARRWGIRDGDAVVVYDATGGLAAARAWWLLRWGGLTDVRLLDGGLDAWVRAGGALETGDVVPAPGDVTLTGGGMPVLVASTRPPPCRRPAGCCSTPGRASGTAARSSRSIRGPGTCRVR